MTIDNTTAEKYTIIAAFAYDKMGLLYAISRTLFELGLSVSTAKIGTHLDQVVDVFYVTDEGQGTKITDELRLNQIRERLMAAIEEVEEKDRNANGAIFTNQRELALISVPRSSLPLLEQGLCHFRART